MPRPCHYKHSDPEQHRGECVLCRLFLTQKGYYLKWGGDPELWDAEEAPPVAAAAPVRVAPAKPQQILPHAIPPKEGPSMAQKVMNFGKALVQHTLAGLPASTQDEALRRQAICASCIGEDGYYDAENDTCAHPKCGCKIKRKSRWAKQECPLGKWELPTVNP